MLPMMEPRAPCRQARDVDDAPPAALSHEPAGFPRTAQVAQHLHVQRLLELVGGPGRPAPGWAPATPPGLRSLPVCPTPPSSAAARCIRACTEASSVVSAGTAMTVRWREAPPRLRRRPAPAARARARRSPPPRRPLPTPPPPLVRCRGCPRSPLPYAPAIPDPSRLLPCRRPAAVLAGEVTSHGRLSATHGRVWCRGFETGAQTG